MESLVMCSVCGVETACIVERRMGVECVESMSARERERERERQAETDTKWLVTVDEWFFV